jgi:hypothetical protein
VLSVDEIIALLKKTSLPTVVIEGDDDVIVYRRLEDVFPELQISILPAGGRGKVLQVFDRLNEIGRNRAICFIADKDTWLFSGIPPEYQDPRVIFTDGYSVENDVFRDGALTSLLVGGEREAFAADVKNFTRWFSLEIGRILTGRAATLDIYPGVVLDGKFEDMTTLEEDERYPEHLYNQIFNDYGKFVRGKSLLMVLARQLAREKRQPRLHHESLLEICSAKRGQLLSLIYNGVGDYFRQLKPVVRS